jgi:DNA-directed RNA polymerase subunit RPC12/RpoP
MEEADFKCMRCGHEFKGPWDKKVLRERTCPKCGSNSVRRIKKRA